MYSPNLLNLPTYEQEYLGKCLSVYISLQEDLGGGTPIFYYFHIFMMTSRHCNFLQICSDICYIVQNILLPGFLQKGIVRKIKCHHLTHFITLCFLGGPKDGRKMAQKWAILLKNGLVTVSHEYAVRTFLMKTV